MYTPQVEPHLWELFFRFSQHASPTIVTWHPGAPQVHAADAKSGTGTPCCAAAGGPHTKILCRPGSS